MKKIFSLLGGIAIIALSAVSYTFAYTQEQQEAYHWAYQYGITTQPTIEKANLNGKITKQAFSKMIINYLENVVGIQTDSANLCSFTDEDKITSDLKIYTRKICAYNIMGFNGSDFKPTQPVNRAQLGTVISRILWGNEFDNTGKGYYIYHLNALKHNGIMNNIKNPVESYAKRGEVLIMLKRIYEKFGTNVYMNDGNKAPSYKTSNYVASGSNSVSSNVGNLTGNYNVNISTGNGSTNNDETDYNTDTYSNSNIIYTGKDGKTYYYDYKFLTLLKNTAEKKGESDLAKYLDIEAKYFKDGLEESNDFDYDEFSKEMGIDLENLDKDTMTQKEKKELAEKFEKWVKKIISENKTKNEKFMSELENVLKNVKTDKFGLKEKYNKTKVFIEAAHTFLDDYSEIMVKLIELSLAGESEENNEESLAQALSLIGASLIYQSNAQEYQSYVEEWGINTVELLGMN